MGMPVRDLRSTSLTSLTYQQHSRIIPNSERREAYIPRTEPLTNETGRESKYGGSIPFFIQGDTWPTENNLHEDRPHDFNAGRPLAFIAQFVDPRSDRLEMTQIFIANTDDIVGGDAYAAYIRKIDLTKNQQQIIIPVPEDVPNKTMIEEPVRIIGWDWVIECSIPFLFDFANDVKRNSWDNIINANDVVHSGFKLGGYGNTIQGTKYEYDFTNIYAGEWGDGGSLHVMMDGRVDGDMG